MTTERQAHLHEHLAALNAYGNGDGIRAEAIRDELAAIDTAQTKARKAKARKEVTVTDGKEHPGERQDL